MARLLVANEQGGPLAQLVVDPMQPPKYRTLGAIIVHTAAVFLCQQRVAILQPFVNMLKNPVTLVVGASKLKLHVYTLTRSFPATECLSTNNA